jgi:hypothetical protein
MKEGSPWRVVFQDLTLCLDLRVGVSCVRSRTDLSPANTDPENWLRGAYHGVGLKHLQRDLNEFKFRFNKREHEADLFSPVLHAVIAADPFPYNISRAERTG